MDFPTFFPWFSESPKLRFEVCFLEAFQSQVFRWVGRVSLFWVEVVEHLNKYKGDMETPINGQPGDVFVVMAKHNWWLPSDFVIDWWSCLLGFLLFFPIKSYVNTASTTTMNTARFAGWIQPFNPCLAAQNGGHPQLSTQDQFKVGLQVVESNGIQNGFQVGQFGWNIGGDTSCTWKVFCGVQGTAQKNSCRWRDMGALINGIINRFSRGYFTPINWSYKLHI